jgi:ABC-type glycerol-3-phosphate transport system substrate-binding protein
MDAQQERRWIGLIVIVIAAGVAAACGGATASPSATAASPAATSSASIVARSLDGPAEAKAGSDIVVTWSGGVRNGDYVTVVAKGGSYKADDPYVNIYGTTSATLKAPMAAGEYEIWWIRGDTTDVVLARHPITITP